MIGIEWNDDEWDNMGNIPSVLINQWVNMGEIMR